MLFNEPGKFSTSVSNDSHNKDRSFIDFDHLREGDVDPALGKTIYVLIENGGDFIVYLDPQLDIQYAVSPSYNRFSPFYGCVLNKVAELEGLSDRSFMTNKQIREYRCMIGAAIARMYEQDSKDVIFEVLNKAEYFLKSRVTETARIWYLSSASIMVIILITIYLLIFNACPGFNKADSHGIFSSILLGACGSYLSIIMNSRKINVNPSSGRIIHFFESITRMIIGMIGGFFTSLVFLSGLINSGTGRNSFINLLILSFIAGFSERMVPNLINQFEANYQMKKS